MFNDEIFKDMKHDQDTVSPKEMKDNLPLIKAQIPIFKSKFSEVSKVKLEVTNNDIDRIIKAALKAGDLNKDEERIMNGFYETWMAIFSMVGSDREALEITFKMIHSQGQ